MAGDATQRCPSVRMFLPWGNDSIQSGGVKLGFSPLYLLKLCPRSYTTSADGEAQSTDGL